MSRSVLGRLAPWSCVVVALFSLAVLTGCQQSDGQSQANQFKPKEEDDGDAEAPPRSVADRNTVAAGEGQDEEPAAEAADSATPAPRSKSKAAAPGRGKTAERDDPALAGPTGDKVKLLRTLIGTEPSGRTEQQKIRNYMTQMEQVLETAEEVLVTKGAPAEAKNEALAARFRAYYVFHMLQPDKESRDKLVGAATDMADADDPQVSTLGKAQLFSLKVAEILETKPEDGQGVIESIETLLQEKGEPAMLLQVSIGAAQQLEQLGYKEDAAAALVMIGDHFAASKDEQVASMGQQVQLNAILGKLRIAEGDDAAALGDELIAKTEEVIESVGADEAMFNPLQEIAMSLESLPSQETASKMYDLLEKSYADHPSKKLAESIQQAVENARTRLSLVGKPFSVEGVKLGGKPFDWQEYEGKIVLVDFWATWCGPCLAEFPNIRANYDKYHDKGFEVVGVNLDDEVETVEEFFARQKLPWPTVISADDDSRGFAHPTAKSSGVDSIPFVVLIGRDGKVAGIHVRGERLEKALEAMLADAEAPAETSPSETEAKDARRKTPADSLR